ncbi:FBD [Raphanus sativus]|nr:FBD [Raphanus sativus]KAJ4881209.1 FBD [Raphanus sativus]
MDYIEEYKLEDSSYSYYFEDTPKLEEADIESTYPDINKFVRSIRSVRRLSLCIRVNADEEALYHEGIVFGQLQHLKLCSCGPNWSNLLARLLKDSPLLRDLEVYLNDDHTYSRVDAPVPWQNQLDCVPTCLLASLETFKWTLVYGSQEEIDLVKYILRNARCLKAATILFRPSFCQQEEEKLEMAKQDLICIYVDIYLYAYCQIFFSNLDK